MNPLNRKLILSHARNPRNLGKVENPDISATAYNPLCGDELTLTLSLVDGKIREIKNIVRGCSLTQASSSIMTQVVEGMTLSLARERVRNFKEALDGREGEFPSELQEAEPLLELKNRPNRMKCVLLPWNVLEDQLASHFKNSTTTNLWRKK